MVRAIITPEETNINLVIPIDYVGRQIEVLYYALDELTETKPQETKTMASFKGILSVEEGEALQEYVKKNAIRLEQRFLMDTNVVISSLSNQLPLNASKTVDKLPGIISVITRIELMGWYNAATSQLNKLHLFIASTQIYDLDEDIIQQTIQIRQLRKIKLPDAIIAATAIIHDHTLLTRNSDDFKNIAELTFENPWLW